jgi:8-oxo-dGTP diphosphatase
MFDMKQPALTVDCVVFKGEAVVLIRRKNEPFKGQYALPGGFVDRGETVEAACARELREETSLEVSNLRLVGVYSKADRDPRGHTVTVAYLGEADLSTMKAGDDAAEVELVADWREQPIAFDHRTIIEDAYRLKSNRT